MKTWQKLRNNPSLWRRYHIREKVIKAIRDFFDSREFHEVETPLLIAHPPAESYVDVFETTLLDRFRHPSKAYLSTSPEVPLKKLLVAGIGNCYCLTKSFRNMETQSNLHNPEFTILEWYRVNAHYMDIMKDCEALLIFINTYLQQPFPPVIPAFTLEGKAGSQRRKHWIRRSEGGDQSLPPRRRGVGDDTKKPNVLTYQGKYIDLSVPWERVSIAQAFKKWAHVDFEKFLDGAYATRIAQEKGYRVEPKTTWEQLYNQLFLNEIEKHLGFEKPTILYDFPSSMAALAKKKASDPRFAQRFEFYIAGLELGDAYSELTDWKEQEVRFKRELRELRSLGKTVYDYDHDFIDAMKVGLPTCSGIAVGVDRLVMLFADVRDIADTLFFPGKELFSFHTDKFSQ